MKFLSMALLAAGMVYLAKYAVQVFEYDFEMAAGLILAAIAVKLNWPGAKA